MSLRNKLFISFAVISLLLLGLVFVAVELRVREQVSADTIAELAQTDEAFVEQWKFLRERLAREGAIVADAPKMKAALDTGDPATIGPVAEDYRQMIGADLVELRDPDGSSVTRLTKGEDISYLELSFPILVGNSMLGSLTTGYGLNRAFAARMKRLVGAEVAVVSEEHLVASTLPPDREAELARTPEISGAETSWEVRLGGESYLARTVSEQPAPGVEFLILRSVDESLRFLGAVRRDLFLFAIFTTVLALLASYLTARTLTRPLANRRGHAGDGSLRRFDSADPHRESRRRGFPSGLDVQSRRKLTARLPATSQAQGTTELTGSALRHISPRDPQPAHYHQGIGAPASRGRILGPR